MLLTMPPSDSSASAIATGSNTNAIDVDERTASAIDTSGVAVREKSKAP
jgi:hypothetical protein